MKNQHLEPSPLTRTSRENALGGPFRIGAYTIDPELQRIAGPSGSTSVEPKILDVLLVLAANAQEVVTRDRLFDQVWPREPIGEEVLTRAISELRRLFGDSSRSPRVIETIRKRGYRLMVPVEPIDAPSLAPPFSEAPPAKATPTVSWQRGSIALVGLATLLLIFTVYLTQRPNGADRPKSFIPASPFTSYPGTERDPALSPDGTRVAFSWDQRVGGDMDIYVKQVATETPLRIVEMDGFDGGAAWSPDGSTIAFVHKEPDGPWGIWTVPSIGGEPVRLLNAARLGGHAYDPSGNWLAYSASDDAQAPLRLHLYNLRTRTSQPIELERNGDATDPVWSPDGKTIAFVQSDDALMQDIYLVTPEGSDQRRLTRSLMRVRGLDWTRDGSALVCASFPAGTFSLWRVDARSGDLEGIPTQSEWIYEPSLARHADCLVYRDLWFEKNIWSVTVQPQSDAPIHSEALISSTRWDCEASYSPDGRHLVFTSARTGHLEVWLCRSDGTHPRQLTHFEGTYVGLPRFSPDGERVAFYACTGGPADLYVMDVEASEPRRVPLGPSNELLASWSVDGKWLYFGSDREGDWRLWKIAAEAPHGSPVLAIEGPSIHGCESTDGQWLYFTRPDREGLYRAAVRDGAAGEVQTVRTDLPSRTQWSNWALQRDRIIFASYDERGPRIVAQDVNSSRLEEIAKVPNIACPSLAVSPDGKTILYARVERHVADIMRVEGFR